jgi:hypothetical protein
MLRANEGSGNDVLMALKDELQYNPLQAVQSIARLANIAQALGAERTRNELLPYLTSEIQQGNLNDEVLRSIAESLHQLVLFVTTTEDVGHLIAPLHELCCAEEHAVRDQAVRTLLRIGDQLPAAVLAPLLVPMVLNLGAQVDWFTPRVSACAMLPLAVALSLGTDTAHGAAPAAAAGSSPPTASAARPTLGAPTAAALPLAVPGARAEPSAAASATGSGGGSTPSSLGSSCIGSIPGSLFGSAYGSAAPPPSPQPSSSSTLASAGLARLASAASAASSAASLALGGVVAGVMAPGGGSPGGSPGGARAGAGVTGGGSSGGDGASSAHAAADARGGESLGGAGGRGAESAAAAAPSYTTTLGAAAVSAASARAGGAPVRGHTAELLSLYDALCSDDSVAVRGSAAAAMASVARALGTRERVTTLLAAGFVALLGDEAESVRIAALGAAASVIGAVSLGLNSAAFPPTHPVAVGLTNASRDKLPSVRIALAEVLPAVARVSPAGAWLARELAVALVGDVEEDVRIGVVLQAASLADGLGAAFAASALLPTLDVSVRDEAVTARAELAGVLMSLAKPLGADGSNRRLLPLIRVLLDDANTNVRLAIVNAFGDLLRVVGVGATPASAAPSAAWAAATAATASATAAATATAAAAAADAADVSGAGGGPAAAAGGGGGAGGGPGSAGEEDTLYGGMGLVEVLRVLGSDANWRVRHASLQQLPTLASLLPPDDFSRRIDLDTFTADRCALVRLDLVSTWRRIAELEGYGSGWLEQHVLPVLRARHAEVRHYERRAVVLEALASLGGLLATRTLEAELLPLALSMASDAVPNLRLLLASSLQRCAPHLSTSALTGRVIPTLEALEEDEDIDVLGAARDALEACHALTHGGSGG